MLELEKSIRRTEVSRLGFEGRFAKLCNGSSGFTNCGCRIDCVCLAASENLLFFTQTVQVIYSTDCKRLHVELSRRVPYGFFGATSFLKHTGILLISSRVRTHTRVLVGFEILVKTRSSEG